MLKVMEQSTKILNFKSQTELLCSDLQITLFIFKGHNLLNFSLISTFFITLDAQEKTTKFVRMS
jgi:hypothetical protein